jgi:hypothetical protein
MGRSEAMKIFISFGQCSTSQFCRSNGINQRKHSHPIHPLAIFARYSAIRLLSFGMLQGKLKSCTARKFDELKAELSSILRRIPEAELITAFY